MDDSQKILDILSAITKISNHPKWQYEEKLNRIIKQIVSCVDAEKGSIMLKKTRHLEVVASTDPNLIGVKQSLKDQTPSNWVVQNKKPLYMGGVKPEDDVPTSNHTHKYTKKAFFVAPIFSNDKVIGLVSLTEKKGTDDCFSPKEQQVLLTIAGHVISALENIRLAKTLKKKKTELSKKNEQLKKLEKLRSEFFHMLIHDLKGPISEVVANLDILSYTADSENMDYVQSAQMACDTLHRMIIDLLDIARLEEKSLPMIPVPLQPDMLVTEAVSRVHGIARAKSITLNSELNNLPASTTITADQQLILRVLQNLLVNAIHFSKEGSDVEVSATLDGKSHIIFRVRDKGPGIPEEFHQSIFNKFVQLDKRGGNRQYSSGLGLTFCRLAVEAHKGSIWVESDGESGSSFMFSLKTDSEY